MTEVHLTRKDSMGRTHTVIYHSDDTASRALAAWAEKDSVQVSCDKRFKIGDKARPTKQYVEQVLNCMIPYEMASQWGHGFTITEIGPDGFPYAGHHTIELEGCASLMLSTYDIEEVKAP